MDVRCSFCLKPAQQVTKIIAGPGSYICDECVARCVDILGAPAVPPSAPASDDPDLPSWTTMTDAELLARLPLIASVGAQVEGALAQWVQEARRRGASWTRIGEALGMTRQAAWERFARAS